MSRIYDTYGVSGAIVGTNGLPLAGCPVRVYSRATGELIASAVTGDGAEEVPGDPFYPSVTSLLPLTGADNGTVFSDTSLLAQAVTPSGNAKTVTSAPVYGDSCAYFDGNGDYLTLPNDGGALGPDDYTVEFWIKFSSIKPGSCLMAHAYPGANNMLPLILGFFGTYLEPSSFLGIGFYIGSWRVVSTGLTPTIDTWHHIAVCMKSRAITFFFNGALHTTWDTPAAPIATSSVFYIGRRWDSYGTQDFFHGFMQDFRVTKGVVRYNASFTPPTSPYVPALASPARPLGEFSAPLYSAEEVQCVALHPDTSRNDLIHRVIPISDEFLGWDPADTATALWLDAADNTVFTLDTTSVVQWSDKSGNDRHATATGTARPVITGAAINGLDVVTFDGVANCLSVPRPFTTLGSFFTVLWTTDSAYILFGPLGTSAHSPAASSETMTILVGSFGTPAYLLDGAATSWATRVQMHTSLHNRVSIAEYIGASLATWPTTIGISGYYSTNWYFSGQIAEIIAVDGAVSTALRERIEGYLAHKWGLTGNLPAAHPYKVLPPLA